MRYITIWRRKTIVASLMTLKVYIEDAAGELVINGVPCRKLGVLKNGEQKRFAIDNGTYRLYVIADKLSRNFCNDFYTIPEGDEDFCVSGKNIFNPFVGNPFRFDNPDASIVSKRKIRSKQTERVVLICAMVIGLIGATIFTCWPRNLTSPPKSFSRRGINITLTEDFEAYRKVNFTAYFESDDVNVYVSKASFAATPGLGIYSINRYYSEFVSTNKIEPLVSIRTEDGISYFEYLVLDADTGGNNRCVAVIYKTDTDFWIVQFETSQRNYPRYIEQIKNWAKSVTFES